MTTAPPPCADKAASDDDPEAQVTCLTAQAILAQMKVMNLSKRIRSLVNGSTAEGYVSDISNTPTEVMTNCMSQVEGTTEKGASDGRQLLASILSPAISAGLNLDLSKRIRSSEMGLDTSEGPDIGLANSERSPSDANSDLQGSVTGGTSDSDELSFQTIAGSDSRRYTTDGTSDSQKCSTIASFDSRRYSTGGRTDSRKDSSVGVSSGLRRFSTSENFDSLKFSAPATSDSRKYSTSGVEFSIYSPKTEVHASTSSKQLDSVSKQLDPVSSMRALLTPATSMQTFLRLVCTEETLVSSSESRPQASVSNLKRYPSEIMLPPPGLLKRSALTRDSEKYPSGVFPTPSLSRRSASISGTREFDWSTTLTIPEIDVVEEQDEYSNSNVSWSKPLEVVDDCFPTFNSPIKEEPRQSTSGRSSATSIPSGHFPTVYVGSERKKFIISFQVITHELFRQLLNSEFYKVEEIDGENSIVLLCDTDYFQRLLFFIDQRKTYDSDAPHAARTSVSSFSKKYDVVAHVPSISASS